MDETLKESLEQFDSLWRRVCPQDECPVGQKAGTYSLEDALLGFIHDEICAGVCASALARMCRGEGRALLLRHAAEAKRHLRRLRAEYFIATGVTAGTNEDCRVMPTGLPALRTAFLQAGDLAARYEDAAERTDSPELREVFLAFASDVRRRARETRSLLIDSF